MPQPILHRADARGVATLTLNAPEMRNPLGLLTVDSLILALANIEPDVAVGAVVLAAVGPTFCAGHDLKEIAAHRADADGGRAFFEKLMQRCGELMQAIGALNKPVIAAVEGMATAAGCELVAACDLAVAGEDARFALPGVAIGLFCSTPLVAVGRAVSRKAAMEMALTGAPIDARRAEAWGLVNRVVPAGEALAEAQALAEGIAARSRPVVALGKRTYRRQIETNLAEAYRIAGAAMVENLALPDAAEGIDAFLGKRPPHWGRSMTTDADIRRILTSVRSIAMVGASANPARPSFIVLKYLLGRGYRMFPINPGLAGQDILGAKVFGALAELPEPVDMVDIFRASEHAGAIVDEALALPQPPRVIWMQLGVKDEAAAQRARARGVEVVMNRCPKIEWGRLSGEIGWNGVNSRVLSSRRTVAGKGFQRLDIGGRD